MHRRLAYLKRNTSPALKLSILEAGSDRPFPAPMVSLLMVVSEP